MPSGPADDVVEAVCASLRPFQWRSFPPQLFARWLLAAHDRYRLQALLAGIPGAAVGPWDTVQIADPDDVRLSRLLPYLTCDSWTDLGLAVLCRELLAVLEEPC
jgi:hypothetical protein